MYATDYHDSVKENEEKINPREDWKELSLERESWKQICWTIWSKRPKITQKNKKKKT